MVDIADDHYALDTGRARTLIGWEPKHSLRETLPRMVEALKADPAGWYAANKLNAAKVAGGSAAPRRAAEHDAPMHGDAMQEHHAEMAAMRQRMLWVHFLVVALGAWLLTSPFQFALFDPAAAGTVRDVTQERGLWDPALRNALTGWSDIASGLLLMLFGALALSPRFAWAQWGTTAVGLWLLFAPLFLWTPSAAAYANDTIVGALAVIFSVLVPMMPGMSHEGMMDESEIPPGWTYSPSSWLQRLPIIALGFFGFLIARYMAAYQLGHIDAVWEPFFSGGSGRNGTEYIITSDVSRAWPIADAGLGATSYMIEALMGAMGSAKRWRTMPWMVTFFFILVVPLGGVSIFFIIIQPIVIGTYCTLCLIAAAAMLVMIPLTLDEVVAMGQYMLRSVRAGRPFWRTFFHGGPDVGGQPDE
ncbi:vitamin K epoxide reductase family protein [Propylenella binzhouense]|uniref:vitamin K epoxide reductase family protein n=1 Tax=Propylenella binzhouense TaxID=2555902 RepID=UPI001FE8BF56|nr:vitamin K epoxide reductase family protein [Propylenella binzhouense]